jgi:hypothetical protein
MALSERMRQEQAERAKVAPGLRQVGWLTQAGNVVTPTGHREQDARLYGWKPVYVLSDESGVEVVGDQPKPPQTPME